MVPYGVQLPAIKQGDIISMIGPKQLIGSLIMCCKILRRTLLSTRLSRRVYITINTFSPLIEIFGHDITKLMNHVHGSIVDSRIKPPDAKIPMLRAEYEVRVVEYISSAK
jgi:hypothetical protein